MISADATISHLVEGYPALGGYPAVGRVQMMTAIAAKIASGRRDIRQVVNTERVSWPLYSVATTA